MVESRNDARRDRKEEQEKEEREEKGNLHILAQACVI
jgi:hypothetical protein